MRADEGHARRARRSSPAVEIPDLLEPACRDWSAMWAWFHRDREALRRLDPIACSALEMAEAWDCFLADNPRH